jgi:hypothetical protein
MQQKRVESEIGRLNKNAQDPEPVCSKHWVGGGPRLLRAI